LSFQEFVKLALKTRLKDESRAAVADAVVSLIARSLSQKAREESTQNARVGDARCPFAFTSFGLKLLSAGGLQRHPKPGAAADDSGAAHVLAGEANPVQLGDAMSVTPSTVPHVKTTGRLTNRPMGRKSLGCRQQLAVLASKLREPSIAFLFKSQTHGGQTMDGSVCKRSRCPCSSEWIERSVADYDP